MFMDYDKAREEIPTISGISHEPTRAAQFRALSVATSIDIAESLRIIAGALLPPDESDGNDIEYPDAETAQDAEDNRPIEIGDVVAYADDFDLDESWIVVATGESEGSAWVDLVDVDYTDRPEGTGLTAVRGWVESFRRVVTESVNPIEAARLGIEAKLVAPSDPDISEEEAMERKRLADNESLDADFGDPVPDAFAAAKKGKGKKK